MEWYLEPFRKYAQFSGRARRREYFTFVIINAVIGSFFSTNAAQPHPVVMITILGGLFSMAIFIPALAVSFRRLHDVGKSGMWMLINLIPVIGQIIFLLITLKDSNYGNNIYGPNPKGQG